MTLSQLKDLLFVTSNQYFIGKENIEVDDIVLSKILIKALGQYGAYRPTSIYEEFTISNERTLIRTIFDSVNQVNREVTNIKQIYVTNPVFNKAKVPYEWKFIKQSKILYTRAMGTYWADFYVIPLIEEIGTDDELFIDLITGYYLVYVGTARSSFALSELPIENNGADLISKGEELIDKVMEELRNNQSLWWEAIE